MGQSFIDPFSELSQDHVKDDVDSDLMSGPTRSKQK